MSLNMHLDFKPPFRNFGFFLGIIYLALTGGGGCNIFGDYANDNSDAAIIFEAGQQIDAQQWTNAIDTLGTLDAATFQSPAVQFLLATAYAGRGGLNVINVAQIFQNIPSGLTFFQFLMQSFTGATNANIDDLATAETVVQNISVTAAGRTVDQNVFMIFLELTKLGSILAADADTDHNKVLDPGFQSCTDVPLPHADQVITSIANLIDSINASGSTVAGNFVSGVSGQCGNLGTICTVYQASSVTALEEAFAQTLVGETALGIGLAVPSETGVCEIPPNGNNCQGQGMGPGTGLCPVP